ncbi:MAG: YIP1 family protein [Oscillospiraceae bacterium]|nr:YIP1 family protein [Oscillospiraceae bacterium]
MELTKKEWWKVTFQTCMFAFRVITHPIEGMWELKHHKKNAFAASNIIMFLLCLLFMLRIQMTGFIFASDRPEDVNIFFQVSSILVPVLAWTILNWSLTTLMDGKGKMVHVYIQTVYGLVPLFLLSIPQILISHFLTQGEDAFYAMFGVIAMIWSLMLIILGNMTVHDFTVSKTLIMAFFTIVAFISVCFLAMLFVNTIQQLFNFFYTIYVELSFAI